jgi:hypothetical protein
MRRTKASASQERVASLVQLDMMAETGHSRQPARTRKLLAPVAILAEALGYAPSTIERHAVDSATAYTRYIAAIRDT